MKRVPDRKKLRREYLKKKGKAYTELTFKGLLCVPLGLFTLISLILAISMLFGERSEPVMSLMAFGIAGLSGTGTWWCLQDVEKAHQAAQLPYVPPVNISSLPADEVLLRGTVQPYVPPDTLLRAEQSKVEPEHEQLLRVASGTTEVHPYSE